MMKYIFVLVLMLFVGCGGGGSSDNGNGGSNASANESHTRIDTLSLNETQLVKNSLRNANYENVSNLVKLSSDIVSFNHEKDGARYYTVLNIKTSEVRTNIKNFKGTAVTSVTKNEITYDNGQKMDVKEYTKESYKPKVSYADPKEIIQKRVASEHKRVDRFVYTPQKGGAMVLISSQYGWDIYKYGLDNPNNPVREGVIASSDKDDVVTEIKTYSGGKMSYKYYTKMSSNKNGNEVFYDYFHMRKISGGSDYQMNNNNQNSGSLKENIQRVLNQNHSSQPKVIKEIKYTSNDSKVIVSVYSNYGPAIYLYDISNIYNPNEDRLVFHDNEEGKQISIEKVYDNRVEFIVGNYGYKYRKTYNFYTAEEIYSDLIGGSAVENNNDNQSGSNNNNISDSDIRDAVSGRGASYRDHVDIVGGSKVSILGINGDNLYRIYTFSKQNRNLVFDKRSGIIINAHQHSDVSVWLSGASGSNVYVGYKLNSIGINESLTYNYESNNIPQNTTGARGGAGSSDYTWEEYERDYYGY